MDIAVDLTMALGAALAPAVSADVVASAGRTLRKAAAPAPPPVFQTAALPSIVEPATYRDAHSNLNPNGSYLALRALRDLVDPVPLFTKTYQPGPTSTEGVWGTLVKGASASNAFGDDVLANARASYANAALSGLDGIPGTWRPVYASPATWADLANAAAFRKVTVDLSGQATGPTATKLATIDGGDVVLEWTTVDANGETTTTPIAGGTQLQSLTLEIAQVTLQRPWLDFGVLKTAGIGVAGQGSGFVSSGDVYDNDGMLPLLPASFWLVRSATLQGTLAPADKRVLAEAGDDTHVTLGGIAVAGPAADVPVAGEPATGQVVAWTSTLLPFWPA